MLLSVVADDFGYCPERNQAIIDAFDRNAITDTSLLVNANYAEHASAAGNMTGLNIGLHFNMSEGRPVSMDCDVSSLIGSDGMFLGKQGTLAAAMEGRLQADHVKLELCAQIERFKHLTGNYPRRVDGHQHVHVFPTVREVFAEALQSYGISHVRVPRDESIDKVTWLDNSNQFLNQVSKMASESAELFSRSGLRTTDAFIGCSLMNFNHQRNLTSAHLDEVLSLLPQSTETCELMAHPGYPCTATDGGCGAGPDGFSKDESRAWEYDFLTSSDFRTLLDKRNIQLHAFELL